MKKRYITFLGGVEVKTKEEATLAYEIGSLIGCLGFSLKHGGYGGIMEEAAKGCKDAGGYVVAVNLANTDWGELNPYVDEELIAETLQKRLEVYLDAEAIIVADGGIGTLFESCYYIHHFINHKEDIKPIVFAGGHASNLLTYLKENKWIVQSEFRDISYVTQTIDIKDIEKMLNNLK